MPAAFENFPVRPWRVAFISFGAAWCTIAFAHLYFYALPWQDTWCYLAPSAVDALPFRLTTPLLGPFGGADHAWGLQWPGVLLLNSIVFAALPAHPAVYVVWETLLWIGAAAALAAVTWQVVRHPAAAFGVFALVLMDRGFFFVAYAQRMELMAIIWLCPLVQVLVERARGRELGRAGSTLAAVAAFLAPLMHLVAAAFAGCAIAIMLWRGRRGAWQGPAREAGFFLCGSGALVAWFLLQPDVAAQFADHARQGAAVDARGRIFLIAMALFYAPTFTGLILYGAGLVTAAAGVWMGIRRSPAVPGEARVMADLGLVALAVFVGLHALHNPYYLLLTAPVLAPLAAAGALQVLATLGRRPRWTLAAAGLAFILLHGAFWATRTLKLLEAGRPNLRAELAAFWASLPAEGKLFVPEALWEEAARSAERRARTRMNTLPNAASAARRRDYETQTYAGLQPGDTLVVDRFQTNPLILDPVSAGWEQVRVVSRPLPGKSRWGFEFVVYRRRS